MFDGLEHIIPRLEESLGGGGACSQGQEDKVYLVPHFGERRFHDLLWLERYLFGSSRKDEDMVNVRSFYSNKMGCTGI